MIRLPTLMLVIICVVYLSSLLVYDGYELDSILRDFFYVEPVVRSAIRTNDSVDQQLHFNNEMLNPSIAAEEILIINEVDYHGLDSTTHDLYSFDYKLGNIQISNIWNQPGTDDIPTGDKEIKIKVKPLVIKEEREFYILKYVNVIPPEYAKINIKINQLVIKEEREFYILKYVNVIPPELEKKGIIDKILNNTDDDKFDFFKLVYKFFY